MTVEECPFRSSKVLHDGQGEFHLCNREGGDCECIPSGCPYLIAKNSKLNLPDLPGYVQIDDEQGVCKDSLQVHEICKENLDSFTCLKDDLVLTWEDMAKIDAIILDVNNEFAVDYSKKIDRQKFYEEVLRRFNEIKYGHEKDTK